MSLGLKNMRRRRFCNFVWAPSEIFIAETLVFVTFFAGLIVQQKITTAHAELDTSYLTGESESCTFTSAVTSAHSANITPGNTAQDIGTTKITTKCVNSLDHQVYAVGYSNDTEGNTSLIGPYNNTIPTGTSSGDSSNWSMKISKDTNSYLPENLTIDNGYNAYSSVPSSRAVVASYTGATDSSTGSAVFATYKVKTSPDQASGDYTGTVKYTLTATMLYNVTIATTAGISKVSLNGVECTSLSGCTVSNLTSGQSYTLTATPADGFTFYRWNPGPNGTVASATTASTTYTVGDGSSVITPTAEMGINTLQIQYGAGVTEMTVNGNAVADNGTVNLTYGTPYIINTTLGSGYVLSGYTFTPNNATSQTVKSNTSFTGNDMQNLDSPNCTSTPSLVRDTRDDHIYTIQRLADGNCWMMENLDLGRTTLTTDLTSSNTNLSTAVTASTFNSWKKTTGSATHNAGEYISVSGTDSTSGTSYGTLYNYHAASAGTITGDNNISDTQYDICPAGWRLPTGGESGEFLALYAQYNSLALMRASIENSGAAFALAGYFSSAAPAGQGSSGNYWSSTRYNGPLMHALGLVTSGVYPATTENRSSGNSIRCILKKQIGDLEYLQDFKDLSAGEKASVLASMADSTTYNLIDNRDNKTYKVAKLKDGNIWMAENLDLGNATLATDLTSSNTNLSATITAAVFNSWKKTTGSSNRSDGEFISISGTDSTSDTNYGTLYNFYATSAGTITGWSNYDNAQYDICPAGWRLPTGGYNTGEFSALNSRYPNNMLMGKPITEGGAAFSLAGVFNYGAPSSQGSDGRYWSSTQASDTTMYMHYLSSSYSGAVSGSGREYGNSIRCIVKKAVHPLTISYGTGIANVKINSINIQNGGTINLEEGVNYPIEATLSTGYSFDNWSTTSGTVSSSNAQITTYIIGSNSAALTATAILSMQNLDSSNCTSSASEVKDTRDGTVYTIQRLNDGNCWMMENLDLGRTTLTTDLTSSNTNLSTTVTASSFNSWKKTSDSATFDAGEYINVSGTDETSGTPYGTLYNYYAASAGTITGSSNSSNASYDICPAGWRLPTGGSSGEFKALYAQYNSYALMRASIENSGAAFALAGVSTGNQGSFARYWSSTRASDSFMYLLRFDTSTVYPLDNHYRKYSYSIRCVLK